MMIDSILLISTILNIFFTNILELYFAASRDGIYKMNERKCPLSIDEADHATKVVATLSGQTTLSRTRC